MVSHPGYNRLLCARVFGFHLRGIMEGSTFSAQLLAYLSGFSGFTAYAVILGVLLACGLRNPHPRRHHFIAAGLLAGLGRISLIRALLAGFIGVMAGDTFYFTWVESLAAVPTNSHNSQNHEQRPNPSCRKKNSREFAIYLFHCSIFTWTKSSPIFDFWNYGCSTCNFFMLDGFAALISVPIWVVSAWYFSKILSKPSI